MSEQRKLESLWFEPAPWINGQSVRGGSAVCIRNPANGSKLAEVHWGDASIATQAIDGAVQSQRLWSRISAFERGNILKAIAGKLLAQRDRYATLLTAEQGKPYWQAIGEIEYAASFFQWFGEEARRVSGRIAPHPQGDREFLIEHLPIGVAGWITPWNFPLAQGAKKIAAALAAGCTGVWKPAESTPLIALAMAPLFRDAGVPDGVVQIVPGGGVEIGAVLVEHPEVRCISVTGSKVTGSKVMAGAAARIKRVSLELGGNAPFIVLSDVDIETAVDHLVQLKLFVTGQVCVTANRIFVPTEIEPAFLECLTSRLARATVADGLQDSGENRVDAGPLIHHQACSGVASLVDEACAAGARLVYQHGLANSIAGASGCLQANESARGSFYSPVVLSDVNDSMRLAQSEIFGPVFPVYAYRDIDEVLRRANGVPQGLAGYVYGTDLSQCRSVARQLDVGIVGVNEWRPLKAEIPFGGIKESGIGSEGGQEGLDEYLRVRVISVPKD
jgi:succinate-semialdehyde dehydrogenase/glutarate-semialdehyde dehydrogenase